MSTMGMVHTVAAQSTTVSLNDLSAFQQPGPSWQIAGDVFADLYTNNKLTGSKGTGILINLPEKKKPGKDLFSTFEHGDIDLELDYMMAKGANSGIYLQGRYELQLEDSWGLTKVSAANNGGVYERWDESRPQGQKGYQGYAPRYNVSRAPGLWQHLKISFQAPRFDANGKKVENARLLRVELNGVLIHEDVTLFGPTRGAVSNEEKATGPLRIQGDHGAVAFRNIKLTNYNVPLPELSKLNYTVYKGKYEEEPDYKKLSPEVEGASVVLTSNLNNKAKQFLLRYTGILTIKEAGEYNFKMATASGGGLLRINKQEVIPMKQWNGEGKVQLPAGELPFEFIYSKTSDWGRPNMELIVSRPGLREHLLSDKEVGISNAVDPILVDATDKPILRSFMDLPDKQRVTHAISVGSKEQVHYTYDLHHGSLVQVWRGGFLDATPMWHDRGDGSSRPIGAVKYLGKPALSIAKLSSDQLAWVADTVGSSFKSKGYTLDAQEQPIFHYQLYNTTVQDAIRVLENGQGLRRELYVQQPTAGMYVRLAAGSTIEELPKGMYLVDGKSYYLRLDNAGGAKPQIRNAAGGQELIIPLREKLAYSIIF